jgi:CheY-like chemotaxis protein
MAINTILIVEDTPVDAIVLRNILEHAGYLALTAGNGVEALEAMDQHPEISLVMSDVGMPEMGGVELLRAIRENPIRSAMPVMFVSGAADAATVRAAVALKPFGYILKPLVEPSRVLSRVQGALKGSVPVIEDQDIARGRTGLPASEFRAAYEALAALLRGGPVNGDGAEGGEDGVRRLAETVGAQRLRRAIEGGDEDAVAREKVATLHVLDSLGF